MTFEHAFPSSLCHSSLFSVLTLSDNYQEDLSGHFSMTLLFEIDHLVILSRIPQLFLAS